MNLVTPIEYLKGVGQYKATLLQKELGIFTFADLLYHYPFRYIDRTRFYKIAELNASLSLVQTIGRIVSVEQLGEKQSRRIVALLRDDTGMMELVWFKGLRWVEKSIKTGSAYIVFGKPSEFNGRVSMSHPELELYHSAEKNRGNSSLQPVYNSTEKLKQQFLDSKGLLKLQAVLLDTLGNNIPETLPAGLMRERDLAGRLQALRDIHFPQDQTALDRALRRLKYEELFFIQLKLLRSKLIRTSKVRGFVFSQVGEKFNLFYKEKLPFDLTNAQKRVIREIRQDMQRGAQMNRLLQGDVGSGKTAVALMTMLLAVDNGFQACMMAPTEILARQHYASVKALAGDGLVTIEVLTGSSTRKQRRVIHDGLRSGSVDILIGTHALLEDEVQFKNLGLAVIDEQHRFGVEQRARLWKKNISAPHVLVMTATPIPRTLAMTLYGDLEVSVIDELPAGRKPIKTIHLFENQRLRMFGFMRQEIAKGRQVYVVYPLIKESEKLDLLYLEAGIEAISRAFPLPEYRISIVHGKLKPADKEFEMQRFVKGETQIMVATTVIEVGVNVPNASVMVIENAERFGLSQLHQLRGRVGRGAEQSFCILMSTQKLSADGKVRLQTMVSTNDGFEISETDLKLRGPGNIEGTQQSGVLDLKLADLTHDQLLLQEARADVIGLMELDPELKHPDNEVLSRYFLSNLDAMKWNKIS